jgi:hypothetical protein
VTIFTPVYNLVPAPGVPAQLGFNLVNPVAIDTEVRNGSDYGIDVNFHNISQLLPVLGASLTLWGVPASPAHDPLRGHCLATEGASTGNCPSDAVPAPFLTLPTSCGDPLKVRIRVNSWENPDVFLGEEAEAEAGTVTGEGVSGCSRLSFEPKIDVRPESREADAPSGLAIELSAPQNEDPTGLAAPQVKNVEIALPPGVSIDPAAADGLLGCTATQIGLGNSEPAGCPDAAKIGEFKLDTPLLERPLPGSVYLAQPGDNPTGERLGIYAVAEASGIVAKLHGRLVADPGNGRLTIGLDVPQLPFGDLELHLFGGPRAVLATPPSCGVFTTTTRISPYSAPQSGPPAEPSSSFAIDSGCAGGFSPTFAAGATDASAGSSTGFALQLGRADGEQYIGRLSTTLPEGFLADLSAVARCGEPEANAGTCPASSRVGTTAIAAGAGPHPFQLAGQVFLTGPYGGAPFGLSIVTPGKAGPFDLGTVVLRAGVSIHPASARLSIDSQPLPTILGGIPLRVRAVHLTIDRPGFMFNPTGCAPRSVEGSISSIGGATAAVSAPFKVRGCSRLPFRPSLTASTRAASAGAGASLRVKFAHPARETNLRLVKLRLPEQLPIRLESLQRACPEATFAARPRACPTGSKVGRGIAEVPILASPLRGTVYLVSHAERAFPGLVAVLEGEGVTIRLPGTTSIRRGVARTAFAVPDVPVSSFQLDFPQGPSSLFGAAPVAAGGFCAEDLRLPTTIVGQNDSTSSRRAKVRVSGCHGPREKRSRGAG